MAETQDQCRGRQIEALTKRTDQLRDIAYQICPTITTSLFPVPNCKPVLPLCECKKCNCNPCSCSCEPTAVPGIAVDVPNDLTPEEQKDGLVYQLQRENAALERKITTLASALQCQSEDIKNLQAQFTTLKNQVGAPSSESDPIYIPDPEETGLHLISDLAADPPFNWGSSEEQQMLVHYFGEVSDVDDYQVLTTAFENVTGSDLMITPKWIDSYIIYEMEIGVIASLGSGSTVNLYANFEGYVGGDLVQDSKSACSGGHGSQIFHKAKFSVPSWKAFTDQGKEVKLKGKTYASDTKGIIHAMNRFDGSFGFKLIRPLLRVTEVRNISE